MSQLVVSTAPTVEPLTVVDVVTHLRLDESNYELPPSAVTAALASPAAPGNVDNGDHRLRVTFATPDGETQAGTASAVVTVADKTVNGQLSYTGIPLGGAQVTSRRLWRTKAGGDIYYLLATIANNTATTYTDNIADVSLGAEAPSTNTTLDPLLGRFIRTARQMAESATRRALITQTLDLYLDAFPGWEITLPKPKLQSVTSITYVDDNGVTQTLDTSLYLVDTTTEPARITPAFGEVWPTTRWQTNAVRIRYVAGYGATAASVPECVKDWMLFQINTMWNTRQRFTISTGRAALTQIPNDYIDGLLAGETVVDFNWGVSYDAPLHTS
jgi:uncharacterized phiE125 gp8 family phage protein